MAGSVIVLNGTSSAGKTTLATTLQARLAEVGECWMIISTDVMFPLLPQAFFTYGPAVGEHADAGAAFRIVDGRLQKHLGPVGEQIFAAYRAWVSATARAGLNVIVDEVVLDADDITGWNHELDGVDVCWVAVEVDLDVLEEREHARGDRPNGLARSQYDIVHRYPAYDVRVDTGAMDAGACAAKVLAARR